MVQVVQLTMLLMSFLYLIILSFLFFVKNRVENEDTKIYGRLIVINIATILIELSLFALGYFIVTKHMENLMQLFLLDSKIYVCIVILWFIYIAKYTQYTCNRSNDNNDKPIKKKMLFLNIIVVIGMLVVLLLPVEFVISEDGSGYTTGPATKVAFLFIVGLCITMIINMIKSRKDRIYKRYLPIIILLVLMTFSTILQASNPQLLLFNPIMVIIVFIMYFTIENPDIKLLQQVEIAKDRADKANQAKSDFLSSMSHEIRTPLNAIVGFSECINQSTTLEEAKENAKDVMGASETLLEIVNGILDISKIESGKIELIENDYSPERMLEETVKLARGRLGDKPLDFQVNITPDIPKVLYGDKFNIKKILINFLTNAIKYTDEGFVRFDVQCVKMNDHVRLIFIVTDSGRGIKKEDINKLFNKFQRLDEEKNQTIEGTGLGLAITKQLIEMMKGTVVVDSVYGEGSKFTFSVDQKISEAVLDDTTAKFDAVVDLTGKKILIVDDNKLNLKVADKLLKVYNPSVTLCNSGPDCIELITNGNKYDLILLDDMMPGMTGVETLHKLKDDPSFNIPTIALTANAINGMKEKYLDAGFDGYLAKPIDKYELNSQLVKFLNNVSSYDVQDETPESSIEVNETMVKPMNENVQEDVQQEIVEEVQEPTSVSDGFKPYVPDNTPIVVLPGNSETKDESTTNDEVEKPVNDNNSKILLIVDDNNLNIKVESKLITSLGYTVESANSGIEAINMVKNNKYDLIFMDIMMPMMDGVQTLHELQKIEGFDVPVVALTADAVLGAKEKYLSEGFDLYVTKPANKDDFDKIIKNFVE